MQLEEICWIVLAALIDILDWNEGQSPNILRSAFILL
jgi:hypothetical protein